MTINKRSKYNTRPNKVNKKEKKLVNNKLHLKYWEENVENFSHIKLQLFPSMNLEQEKNARENFKIMLRKGGRYCFLGSTSNDTTVHTMYLSKNQKYYVITKSSFGAITVRQVEPEEYLKE